MEKKYEELLGVLGTGADISSALSLLSWDMEAYMPPGGSETRGRTMATLGRIAHENFTSDKVGSLLEDLKGYAKDLEPDSDEARIIKVAARDYDKATKVPPEMVEEIAMLRAEGSQAWKKAKEDNDFPHFQPVLEKLLDYNLRYIELFKPYDHPYDVLLDSYEPEMKTADVKEIFSTIRPQQVELIEKIAAQPQLDDSVLHQFFEADKQLAAGREVTAKFGYDWQRGRQDAVTHPFATNLGYGDQRITYTVDENYLNSYLFAIFHEAGHAMYEQGVSKHLYRTSVYGGTSLAIHESQSRLWENLVGRSKPFWEYYFPKLQELFPSQLENTTLDDFYKAMNKVEPSLIRIEADEATYNLHVMLRLEIEMELIEGKLAVKDLPDAWNSRTEEYLGLTPPNDSQGVLQDVHWSMGYMGYFSTYALGNLVSAQLWEKIYETYPDMDDQIRSGDFSNLFNWLNEQIYQHGSKFEPQELVERITGSKITGEPYIKYLNDKFGELYGV